MLATLLRPTAGELTVLGAELPRRAWKARGRIGYLGHDALLYSDLTVAEALTFHADLHRVPEPAERIADLLARVGLERRAAQLVRTLSAGQAQRAAVVRCVLHAPARASLARRAGCPPRPRGVRHRRAADRALVGRDPGGVVTHDVEGGLADANRALALHSDGSVAYEGPAAGLSAEDARTIYSRDGRA